MWPKAGWYNKFDYQKGIDPYTKKKYNQEVGDSLFSKATASDFVDRKSFVSAFGVENCYLRNSSGTSTWSKPSNAALLKWKAVKSNNWGGSCFGIASANTLAFENPNTFKQKWNNFPSFTNPKNPRDVKSDNEVRKTVTTLFSHQLGNPTWNRYIALWNSKTPTQTINDMKAMLKEDDVNIRVLVFWSNNPKDPGGHAINFYKIEQDKLAPQKYNVYVWDNSYPDSLNAIIVVDTSSNKGKGSWDPQYGWDGTKPFMLNISTNQYYSSASLKKKKKIYATFLLDENELEVYNNSGASIEIKDNQGNTTGFNDSGFMTEIPNSVPRIRVDGSNSPPYGYHLQNNNYSITMNNFTNDTVNAFAFSGNKIFEYERSDAKNSQTDKLFFDGGISVSNPNSEMKTVKLLNVISDSTSESEKLFLIKSLNLVQNDSVKIINPNEDNLDIVSYGLEKTYSLEVKYVSEDKISRFSNDNVVLTTNSRQKIVPNWEKTGDLEISVYVDEGNDGTIDDTLEVDNQVTSVKDYQGSTIPTEFKLEQNYPNPFNPVTNIRYSIAKTSKVTITVFDILGKEIATLVSEKKTPGFYEVKFDATRLTSGVYFYTIRTNDFIETKKCF